ncbi:LysM peptidoglycan-binding domain-containing protein [Streptomyces antimycoticus]|uniref:LysM peptidoglycan-binding domain-containing protein n=1 Tax=Streptomyces antimycoticus TaxID=68175 RepID=UPI003864699E|nr:LysM peptidoglycan-binding domain-containing protein [Streptomyces antimycoticus]
MHRTSRRRTAVATAMAVPLVLLAGAPAVADTGSGRITDCTLQHSSGGGLGLDAKVRVDNSDQNTDHTYYVEVKFSHGATALGNGSGNISAGAGLPGEGTISASTTSPDAQNQPNEKLDCVAKTAEDDNGDSITVRAYHPSHTSTPTPNTPRPNTPSERQGSYTVARGDTLSGIAQREYGDASEWTRIYDANRQTIEQAAQDHGLSSSDHGHWIFPGTQLVIPQ